MQAREIHPGFETQDRCHQKSNRGVSVVHKETCVLQIFFLKKLLIRKICHEVFNSCEQIIRRQLSIGRQIISGHLCYNPIHHWSKFCKGVKQRI